MLVYAVMTSFGWWEGRIHRHMVLDEANVLGWQVECGPVLGITSHERMLEMMVPCCLESLVLIASHGDERSDHQCPR